MKKSTIFLITLCVLFLSNQNTNASNNDLFSVRALTPITQINIKSAVIAWISEPASAETTYGHIKDWDVSGVNNMSFLFYEKASFNEDISNWNVSNVSNMYAMFFGATNFNQDIGSWDVANVTSMRYMLLDAINFNQDIGFWDVSNVTNMDSMFAQAINFNQDISSWDLANVTNMFAMFGTAKNFNQDIGSWDVSNVTNMSLMFYNASNFNQDLSSWCVSNITSEPSSFSLYSAFEESNKPVWGTCNSLSTSNFNINKNIKIYNLNNNEINISGITIGDEAKIELFDVLGKRAGSYAIKQAELNNYIQLNNLKTGQYIVKLKTSSLIKTKKIFIN